MKKMSIITLLFALIFCSCKKNKTTAELRKKLIQLEKINKEKDKKVMALAVTVQMLARDLNQFDHSGISIFFDAPEFWEDTYNINPFRCNTACGSGYGAALKRCNTIQDSKEREKCINETNSWFINCISGCPPVNP